MPEHRRQSVRNSLSLVYNCIREGQHPCHLVRQAGKEEGRLCGIRDGDRNVVVSCGPDKYACVSSFYPWLLWLLYQSPMF